MWILAFESSCDETAVALYHGQSNRMEQLIHSQVALHHPHGGVVPELAARSHLEILPRITQELMHKVGIDYQKIAAIAYTRGPGLVGPLLIGASFAKSLAVSLEKPLFPVHHLEAHMLIAMQEHPKLSFPFNCLLVSGGHTMLVFAEKLGHYEVVGQTLDDAAGEAFDKGGKLLALGYPAGKKIERLAKESQLQPSDLLPMPLLGRQGYDFSFSGLKTAFSQLLITRRNDLQNEDYSYALQYAICGHLIRQTKRYYQACAKAHPLVLAGGVAANKALRDAAKGLAATFGVECFVPKFEFCTDNAAMIAYAAYLRKEHAKTYSKEVVEYSDVAPRWLLETLDEGL